MKEYNIFYIESNILDTPGVITAPVVKTICGLVVDSHTAWKLKILESKASCTADWVNILPVNYTDGTDSERNISCDCSHRI